jgi:hypothetical protein
MDRQRAERQAELTSVLSLILDLQRRLDDVRQEKKRILKLKEEGQNPAVHELHAAREKEKRLKREIKDGERKIQTGREALRAIDWQKEEQFFRLGTLIDELRPDHKDFLGGFVQIDKLNRKILHYMNEIEKFR